LFGSILGLCVQEFGGISAFFPSPTLHRISSPGSVKAVGKSRVPFRARQILYHFDAFLTSPMSLEGRFPPPFLTPTLDPNWPLLFTEDAGPDPPFPEGSPGRPPLTAKRRVLLYDEPSLRSQCFFTIFLPSSCFPARRCMNFSAALVFPQGLPSPTTGFGGGTMNAENRSLLPFAFLYNFYL